MMNRFSASLGAVLSGLSLALSSVTHGISLHGLTTSVSDQPDSEIDPVIAENDAEFFMLTDECTNQQMMQMAKVGG